MLELVATVHLILNPHDNWINNSNAKSNQVISPTSPTSNHILKYESDPITSPSLWSRFAPFSWNIKSTMIARCELKLKHRPSSCFSRMNTERKRYQLILLVISLELSFRRDREHIKLRDTGIACAVAEPRRFVSCCDRDYSTTCVAIFNAVLGIIWWLVWLFSSCS